ncbi:hypothetical protein [Bradyrhizobium erythrophlei]|uniref:Nucleoside-specific outer membrane channel protein Tsx n=1 Tax=Bradyrhizobium erythrophlei TaxID=1437360 RepID=A0A1H4WRE3_9BRAD|nr:hypothetical protein [Bradyrhizobium erythrophlei]SEC95845.1 hypothetical protein SAMN05444164_3217 [Bradyrhizobium erythrophlei]
MLRFLCAAMAGAALIAFSCIGPVHAADQPEKAPAPAKPVDVPLFFVNDNRLTYAYEFTATDPAVPGTTAKQVFAFTHFDAWQYGTNLINLTLLKSDHNDPASPCPIFGTGCAGEVEFYGLIRSTFGWNEIFNTKAFTVGPLRNISFEVGVDGETANAFYAPNKRNIVAGLQFAVDLPYQGYVNVAPLYYKEWSHNAFASPAFSAPSPGIVDGNLDSPGTWALEVNYFMDLGFLPAWLPLSVSGRAGWYGARGTGTGSLVVPGFIPTRTELNSEPIRLTLDASKAFWGDKYSHLVDLWVAYRYWQNKYGLDHVNSSQCTGLRAGSCTESTLYSGITVKF